MPSRRGPNGRPTITRFMAKVEVSSQVYGGTPCWDWTGARENGYAVFFMEDRAKWRKWRAHRWSHEHHFGPAPDGMVIDHLCRNQACVNPAHLEPVTQAVNVQRGYEAAIPGARKLLLAERRKRNEEYLNQPACGAKHAE